MKREIVFNHCRVVTHDEVLRGTVQVIDGTIWAVDSGDCTSPTALDLEGDFLLPGLIELHTDNLEKHIVPRPGVRWPEMAATVSHDAAIAAAGITTVFDALALGDIKQDSERIRELDAMAASIKFAKAQGLLRADHFLHLRCEVCYPSVLELFASFADEPLVRLVSLMDHTPGQRQFVRMEKFLQYYQGKYSLNDSEMEELIQRRQENQKRFSDCHRGELLRMSRQRGLSIASHDDTTVEHVQEAASSGIGICEFPTTKEAAETARELGLVILMGAPNMVLGQSQSGNISARELAREGLLDVLSSDYVPMSLLHGAFHLHQELEWPLPQAVRVVSANPARVANLRDRGTIEVGKRADLIRVKDYDHMPLIKGIWGNGERIC
jgi:alpha-D-ribose 1-methylphosphonate 5-triphosphate diphosphatase